MVSHWTGPAALYWVAAVPLHVVVVPSVTATVRLLVESNAIGGGKALPGKVATRDHWLETSSDTPIDVPPSLEPLCVATRRLRLESSVSPPGIRSDVDSAVQSVPSQVQVPPVLDTRTTRCSVES